MDELREVLLQLDQRRLIDIHHVASFVITHAHVRSQVGGQFHMVEGVFCGEVWGREIIITVRYKNLQIRVVRHRVTQGFGDIQVTVPGGAVVPRGNFAGQNFVGQIAFKL